MYLVLRPPWGGAPSTAPIDAGPVASAPSDAGTPSKPKKKRRRPAGTVAAPGTPAAPGEEEYYEETEAIVLTDADRRLEWRGDDATLPPRSVDMGGGAEARPLDDGEINSVISSQSGGLRDCVVQGATGTDLRATISIKLVVDGNGKVTKTRVQAPRYLFEKGLQGCVQRAAGRMKFPSTGAPTLVTLPVNLG